MTITDVRKGTSVVALVRLRDQTFPFLPIKPLNSVKYTGMLLGDLGPTKIYKLMKGPLDARKIGDRTYITGESIKAYIDALPKGVANSPNPEGRRHGEKDGSKVQPKLSAQKRTERPNLETANPE